jgi:hypothetical protein
VLAAAVAAAACGGPQAEPLAAPPAPGLTAGDPALAVDPETGDLLLAWLAGDSAGSGIWFARSADDGSTWSAPSRVVGSSRDLERHAESSPRIVAARGALAVVWATSLTVAGRAWPASNVRIARSVDGGRTWSAAVTLNDDTAAAPIGHTFHGAAWEGDSGIVVAWLDERQPLADPAPGAVAAADEPLHDGHATEENATLYLARSRDLGATWSPANRVLWGDVCSCCRVTLARGPSGAVAAAWRNVSPENARNVVVAALDQATPNVVHDDGWVINACPHTGPGLAVDRTGASHVVWFSGKEGASGIYYARRPPGAAAFASPRAVVGGRTMATAHATVAARPAGGAYVVLDLVPGGRRRPQLAIVDTAGVVRHRVTLDAREGADHPQVVAIRDGAAVAWTEIGGNAIRLARVRERRSDRR